MNNNFGNLSLGAAEWKPPAPSSTRGVHTNSSTGSSTSNTNSDLNAGQVKEFIPGQGWIEQSSSDHVGATNTIEAHIGR
jgi:hypothetical protein